MESRVSAPGPGPTSPAARMDLRWRMWAWVAVGLIGLSVTGLVADAFGVALAHAHRLRTAVEHPLSAQSSPGATLRPSPIRPVPPLRVAVTAHFSPARALAMHQELADFLGEATGRPAAVLLRSSYRDTCQLARTGGCEVAFVDTGALAASAGGVDPQVVAVPMIGGQVGIRSYVVVRRQSQYQSLLEMHGARFASADPQCAPGWLFAASWLESRGVEAEPVVGQHIVTGSHDRAIEAVRMGYADAAAVASFVYDRLAEEEEHTSDETRIILKSPLLPPPPIVVPSTLDAHTRQVLQQALLTMHEDVRGEAALDALGFDRFVQAGAPHPAVRASVGVGGGPGS